MTRTIGDIEREILNIKDRLKPLIDKHSELTRELRKLKSIDWIETYGVRRADIETVDGDGKPYFQHIDTFAEWLRRNSDNRFCEWSGIIYFTAEIIAGRMDPNAPGRIEDAK